MHHGNLIFILELLAAFSAMCVVCNLYARAPARVNIVLLIDNDPALAALIRGSSDSDLAGRVISNFWRAADAVKVSPWLERVASKANWADAPSRDPAGHRVIEFPSL